MTQHNYLELAKRFEGLEIDAAAFAHEDHVETAYAMLRKYPFMEATTRYAETIKTMASNAGAADKFHTTITLAFMGLIAERMGDDAAKNWPDFIARNPDLLTRNVLNRWYSRERLGSTMARTQFLLPDIAAT